VARILREVALQAQLRPSTQKILDETLDHAPEHAQQRFTAALADTTDPTDDTATTDQIVTAPSQVPLPSNPLRMAVALPPPGGDQLAPLDPQLLRNGLAGSVLPLMVAGGRVFTGSVINARVFPAVDDVRIVATIPVSEPDSWMPGWPGRELPAHRRERSGHPCNAQVLAGVRGHAAGACIGRTPSLGLTFRCCADVRVFALFADEAEGTRRDRSWWT
jgi:hypothetical protein